ncbi:hypothetical protein [Ekhidna sp.]|uniref:hypothetical protein n=1 Tax=Ekhidna sp. TaxID=2608089 RepID=UPI003C798BC4
MDRSFLQLEYSGWWVLLIVLLAAGLSYFLYTKKNVPWGIRENWILAIIRFLGILGILLLLLSPSVRNVTNTVKKPVIGIALDNSESVVERGVEGDKILEAVERIETTLKGADMETTVVTFSDSLFFNAPTTSLSDLIDKTEQNLKDENLAALVIVTDGIYNRGSSPLYKSYITPVFTLGLGDTIPPKDISISRTLYNSVTFKGNETPIRLEVSQQGYDNRQVSVQLSEGGTLIEERKIRLRNVIEEVEFIVKSEEEGLRHLVANISPLQEESTVENNQSNVFMEVIDGRQKVLFVASSPHPDIKAIRSSLEATGNYDTEVYIPEIQDEKPNDIYDVVVFHGAFTAGVQFIPKEKPGVWYILSNESSITSVNKALPYINIERRGSQPDKVVGSFNQNFSKFKIEDAAVFEEYPPIEVPFGNYTLSGPTEIVMYQQLGSVKTQKPLMAVYDDGSQKSAVLLGQDIWKWKLQEAAIHKDATHFENLITKTIQFLSVKNDKKQFRFDVRESSYLDSEPALFDVEVYNDIYERTYGNDIAINITSENGESQGFNFTDSEYNSTFRAPILSQGIYRYQARVNVGDKTLTDQGEFSIQDVNPEYLNLTANHRLLKNISKKTGGSYVHINDLEKLISEIQNRGFKSIIKSDEELVPLYRAWWWYLIIFMLFSTEWLLRKYWGGY